MDDFIERHEFDQYAQRMDDEHHRQNRRIELLETNTKQISALATSVEKLALSLQSMVKEQEQQGKRLAVLESRDGEKWRKVTGYIITTVIGIVIGYISKQIGIL